MANFSVSNVKISGISSCVPRRIVRNSENTVFDKDDVSKFSASTGVEEFRAADPAVTTSDLGLAAAEELLNKTNINRDEIDILIFVSQTPDYNNIPNTAPILQDKLKLSRQCLSFDIPLGCSGFIYGISTLAAFLQNPAFRKGLLIFGDTATKVVNLKDKTSAMLFGDAAGAAILERDENTGKIFFNLGSDGSGYKAIIVPDGGARTPFSPYSLTEKEIEKDVVRKGSNLVLEGMDVFAFGISQAPKSVRELYEYAGISNEDVDFAVFHQANMMMNEMIRKKLKLETEKVPYSLQKFGNTSSASIPVTITTQLQDQLKNGEKKLLLCGFGVGLSWGSCYFETNNLIIPDLIEI